MLRRKYGHNLTRKFDSEVEGQTKKIMTNDITEEAGQGKDQFVHGRCTLPIKLDCH